MYSFTLSWTLPGNKSGQSTPRPGRFTPGERPGIPCIGCWVGPRAGLDDKEYLAPTGIRSPNRPARSQLLRRLSYPGPRSKYKYLKNTEALLYTKKEVLLVLGHYLIWQFALPSTQISSVNGTQRNVRRYCELAVRRGLRVVFHWTRISVNIWFLLCVFQEPVSNVFLWLADTRRSDWGFYTLTEVLPCFFLSKANARV